MDLKDVVFKSHILKGKLQQMGVRLAKQEGLTGQEFAVLIGIKTQKFHHIGDVADFLSMKQANASALCKRMEQDGYILREKNEIDVRVVNLKLDPKGEKKLKSILKRVEAHQKISSSQKNLLKVVEGMDALMTFIDELERGI